MGTLPVWSKARWFAIEALGRLRDRQSLPLLVEIATASDLASSHGFVARALGELGDPSACTTLDVLTRSPDSDVRQEALSALQRLRQTGDAAPVTAYVRANAALTTQAGVLAAREEQAAQAVTGALRRLEETLRQRAPDAFMALSPGAPLATVVRFLGPGAARELCALFAWHDGQKREGRIFPDPESIWRLCSLADMAAIRMSLADVDLPDEVKRRWVPIATNDGGDHVFYRPRRGGQADVVTWFHDDPVIPGWTSSLAEWVDGLVSDWSTLLPPSTATLPAAAPGAAKDAAEAPRANRSFGSNEGRLEAHAASLPRPGPASRPATSSAPTATIHLETYTPEARRAVGRGQGLADARHDKTVTPQHVLVALLEAGHAHASVRAHGIEPLVLFNDATRLLDDASAPVETVAYLSPALLIALRDAEAAATREGTAVGTRHVFLALVAGGVIATLRGATWHEDSMPLAPLAGAPPVASVTPQQTIRREAYSAAAGSAVTRAQSLADVRQDLAPPMKTTHLKAFTPDARAAVARAQHRADGRHDDTVTALHILAVILESGHGHAALRSCGLDPFEVLREAVGRLGRPAQVTSVAYLSTDALAVLHDAEMAAGREDSAAGMRHLFLAVARAPLVPILAEASWVEDPPRPSPATGDPAEGHFDTVVVQLARYSGATREVIKHAEQTATARHDSVASGYHVLEALLARGHGHAAIRAAGLDPATIQREVILKRNATARPSAEPSDLSDGVLKAMAAAEAHAARESAWVEPRHLLHALVVLAYMPALRGVYWLDDPN